MLTLDGAEGNLAKLANNESIAIVGMPYETNVTITETNVNAAVWTTTWNNEATATTEKAVKVTESNKQIAVTAKNTRTVFDGDVDGEVNITKNWIDSGVEDARRPATDEFTAWVALHSKTTGEWSDTAMTETVTNEGNDNTYEVNYATLPATDVEGNAYSYAVVETIVDGNTADLYVYELSANTAYADGIEGIVDGGSFTNTLMRDIEVEKTWVAPEEHQRALTLTIGRKATETVNEFMTVALPADGEWVDTIRVEAYDENNVEYLYGITDEAYAEEAELALDQFEVTGIVDESGMTNATKLSVNNTLITKVIDRKSVV